MNNTQFYLLLVCVIVLFESIAQYHIKQSKINNNMLYILIAIASYSIICLLLHKCYDFMGMGITNFVWSVVSIVSILLIGTIIFDEKLTKYDILGVLLAVSGLYLIFIKGHPN
jgi:multidrug transporter EmrE-like cation transporter